MLRNRSGQLKQRCRRQSIRNNQQRQYVKTLGDDLMQIKKQLTINTNIVQRPRNFSPQILGQNIYLVKKLHKRDNQISSLKNSVQEIQKQLKTIQNQRNTLMKQKLTMGIEISRLTEQNILLHNKSKLLKEKDCIICGLQAQIQLLKKTQVKINPNQQLDSLLTEFRKSEHQRKLKHIQNGGMIMSSPKGKESFDELEKYKRKYRKLVEENNQIKFKIAEVECRNEELVRVDKERQEELGEKISQLEEHMKQMVSENKFLKKKLKQKIEK